MVVAERTGRCRNNIQNRNIFWKESLIYEIYPQKFESNRKKSGRKAKKAARSCAVKGKQSESEKKKQNIRKDRDFNRQDAKSNVKKRK